MMSFAKTWLKKRLRRPAPAWRRPKSLRRSFEVLEDRTLLSLANPTVSYKYEVVGNNVGHYYRPAPYFAEMNADETLSGSFAVDSSAIKTGYIYSSDIQAANFDVEPGNWSMSGTPSIWTTLRSRSGDRRYLRWSSFLECAE